MKLNQHERAEFDRIVKLPVEERLPEIRRPRKFDPNINGGMVALELMRRGLLEAK